MEITDPTHVGILNPYRYYSYYYDTETGLYYLKARYYDPNTGRFISPDDFSYLDPDTVNGLNLYAYCLNNPVMHVDPSGHAPWWSGALFGAVGGGLSQTTLFSGINLFGSESRQSTGWDSSPNIATGFFGRIGLSSYVTQRKGRNGILYAFSGYTSDIMNWFEKTYYAGVGINLFDIIGVEIQVETVGIGAKVSIGNYSIGANINIIGGTSITVGKDTKLADGSIETKGVTVGINTGFLVAAICWICKLIATGDPSLVPGLQPA